MATSTQHTAALVVCALALAPLIGLITLASSAQAQDSAVLFEDDFSDPARGWQTVESSGMTVAVQDGALHITLRGAPTIGITRLAPDAIDWTGVGDFSAAVDILPQEGRAVAGIVLITAAGEYRAGAQPDTGQVTLRAADGDTLPPLIDARAEEGLPPGGAPFRLGVQVKEGRITLISNGHFQGSAAADLEITGIGLFAARPDAARADGDPAVVSFDNFSVQRGRMTFTGPLGTCAAHADQTDVNVREGPGLDYVIRSMLWQGRAAPVLGRHGDWLMVRLQNGLEGWLLGELVRLSGDCDTVPALDAPLRATPQTPPMWEGIPSPIAPVVTIPFPPP